MDVTLRRGASRPHPRPQRSSIRCSCSQRRMSACPSSCLFVCSCPSVPFSVAVRSNLTLPAARDDGGERRQFVEIPAVRFLCAHSCCHASSQHSIRTRINRSRSRARHDNNTVSLYDDDFTIRRTVIVHAYTVEPEIGPFTRASQKRYSKQQ